MSRYPHSSGAKSEDKVPVKKRLHKRKPLGHPKRPLSAYNFFFKEERVAIVNAVKEKDKQLAKTAEGAKKAEEKVESKVKVNDEATASLKKEESADDSKDDAEYKVYLDDKTYSRLKKEDGKGVSFEEIGKLIGQHWRQVDPIRLAKYTAMSKKDAERYKIEMVKFTKLHEAKLALAELNSAREVMSTGSKTPDDETPLPFATYAQDMARTISYQDNQASTLGTSAFSSLVNPSSSYYPSYGSAFTMGQQSISYPLLQHALYGTVSSQGVSGNTFMNAGQQYGYAAAPSSSRTYGYGATGTTNDAIYSEYEPPQNLPRGSFVNTNEQPQQNLPPREASQQGNHPGQQYSSWGGQQP